MQVYPNPIDGQAKVSYYLNSNSTVTLNLYTAFGQLVNTRSLGVQNAGQHSTLIDGTTLKPGVYILQLNTGTGVYSRKVSVIR
jgi:flagellar hook assembly protein FlgD